MSARRTAYTAEWVLPMSSAPIRRGVVVVDGARIALVAPADASRERWSDAQKVSLGHAALLPGLVNAHSHLELTALRGFLEGLDFRDWLRTLTAVRRELFDAAALRHAAHAGIHEGLRHGVTTFADTASSVASLLAMREAGVRGIGYVETFGPDPRAAPASIAELRRVVDEQRTEDTDLVRTGVSPHAPYTVSPALFREVASYAASEALPVAVHVAESADESRFVREGTGGFADGLRSRDIAVAPLARSPVALLDASGLLAATPLLVHAIQVDAEDLRLIRDRGATIVHCPISNAKLGHGVAPVLDMRSAGIAVGLGTDSVASNDRMDLLGEARMATLLQSLTQGRPDALSASDALRMATAGGASALRLDSRIGTLDAGKDADLAAFPLDGPDAGTVHDPAVTLVHVLAGAVRACLVTVAGRVLVRDGQVLDGGVRPAGATATESHGHAHEHAVATLGDALRQWRAR